MNVHCPGISALAEKESAGIVDGWHATVVMVGEPEQS
jgi:hypothetical protein